ncbi:hypothetical protein MTO96_045611 [Rhipicephalus appendiculatus]
MAAEFFVELSDVNEAVSLSGACTSMSSCSHTLVGSTQGSEVAMEARNIDLGYTGSNSRRHIGCSLRDCNTVSSRVPLTHGVRLPFNLSDIALALPAPIGLFFTTLEFLHLYPNDHRGHIRRWLGIHVLEGPLTPAQVVGIWCRRITRGRRVLCAYRALRNDRRGTLVRRSR